VTSAEEQVGGAVPATLHRRQSFPSAALAAAASAGAGLLVIGALIFPVSVGVLASRGGSAYHEVEKSWITSRYSSVVDAQPGQPSQIHRGTAGWSGWPLSVLCILALFAVAVLLLLGRRPSSRILTGLLVFGLSWTGSMVLGAVSAFEGDAGGNIDQTFSVGGGWWFLVASDVLVGAALVLLWLAAKSQRPDVHGSTSARAARGSRQPPETQP
jgi:hypothetical protein